MAFIDALILNSVFALGGLVLVLMAMWAWHSNDALLVRRGARSRTRCCRRNIAALDMRPRHEQ